MVRRYGGRVAAAAFLLMMMVVGDFLAVHKIRHLFCLPTGKVRFPPLNFNLATYLVFSCKFILCFFPFRFKCLGFLVNGEELEHF